MTDSTLAKFDRSPEENIAAAVAIATKDRDTYLAPAAVLDQMVRALSGCDELYNGFYGVNDAYNAWKAVQAVATPD